MRVHSLSANLLLAVATLAVVELVSRMLVNPSDRFYSIALPPHQVIQYQAQDFAFTSSTNRLGFRGPEFPVEKTLGVLRIAVLGDSFVYGWGLDYEDTWPRVLEKCFARAGIQAEVANLATPGTNFAIMGGIAARAFPLLKPDVAIIAALQGDVVHRFQSDARTVANEDGLTMSQRLAAVGMSVLPSFSQLLQTAKDWITKREVKPASIIRREWKSRSENFLRNMDAAQRHRFERLDPETADRFLSGSMNIPLIVQSISNPELFVEAAHDKSAIARATPVMSELFREIDSLAKQRNAKAKTFVVAMPYAAYLGGEAAGVIRQVGFSVPHVLAGERASESLIGDAATAAKLDFISMFPEFQSRAARDWFIPFDGHYSKKGAQVFSDILCRHLAERLRVAPEVAANGHPDPRHQN
jgi:hypothetical protein